MTKKYFHNLALVFLITLLSILTPAKAVSQANTPPNLCFELTYNSGMFAVFGSVLGALHLYEQGHMAGLTINLDQGIYWDPEAGPNWWEYFFEPIHLGNQQAPRYKSTIDEGSQLTFTGLSLSKERNFGLIQKYIRIKPHIQAEVDAFIKQYFKSFLVIGVHHRGTDKQAEWPIVSYEKTYQTIKQVIKKSYPFPLRKKVKIFVATDDQNFLTYLENLFPKQLIYNNFVRSSDGTPLHHGAVQHYANNYQKGKEALIDCLLLSHCPVLIRPQSSCLSLVSTFFNPYSEVISLVRD